jgi:hypothetical protein
LLVLGATAGCSPDTTTRTSPVVGGPGQTSEVTITGPAGATVTVPPGASVNPVSITIAQNPGDAPPIDARATRLSSVFAVTPHGAQFSKPVTVRIPLETGPLDQDEPVLVLKAEQGEDWVSFGAFALDDDAVEVPVTGFSYFAVVQLQSLPSQPASLTLEPLDPRYTLAGDHWVDSDDLGEEPTLLKAKVTVTGHLDCKPGATQVIRVYSTALPDNPGQSNPHRKFYASSASAAVHGWPSGSSEIEMPMFVSSSVAVMAFNLAGLQREAATFQVNAALRCSDDSLAPFALATTSVQRHASAWYPGKLGFGSAPQDVSVASGERPVFSVLVLGGAEIPTDLAQYTVEWQRSDDGGATWRGTDEARAYQSELAEDPHLAFEPSAGEMGEGFAVRQATFTDSPARPEDDGAMFHVRVCRPVPVDLQQFYASPVDCALSPAARLTVSSTSVPVFTTQPQSALVVAGSTGTLAAVASGAPTPSLRWQSLAPGASAWVDIPGATGNTYTTSALGMSDNGTGFRAVATNSSGSATSAVGLVAVSPVPVAPTIQVQPVDVSAAPGATARFGVVARGSDPLS